MLTMGYAIQKRLKKTSAEPVGCAVGNVSGVLSLTSSDCKQMKQDSKAVLIEMLKLYYYYALGPAVRLTCPCSTMKSVLKKIKQNGVRPLCC